MTVTLRIQTTYNMVLYFPGNILNTTLNQQQAIQIQTLIVLIQRFACIH